MYAYSLTGMTGRRKNDGRTIAFTFGEMNRHTFMILLLAGLASFVPTALLGGVLMAWTPYWWACLSIPLVCIPAAWWLFDTRSKRGLQLQRYQHVLDGRRGRGSTPTMRICGGEFEPNILHITTPQYLHQTTSAAPSDIVRGERVKTPYQKAPIFDA